MRYVCKFSWLTKKFCDVENFDGIGGCNYVGLVRTRWLYYEFICSSRFLMFLFLIKGRCFDHSTSLSKSLISSCVHCLKALFGSLSLIMATSRFLSVISPSKVFLRALIAVCTASPMSISSV